MIGRRDMLIGAACFATAGTTLALKPHRRMNLLAGAKLDELMPHAFGAWRAEDIGALIAPAREDSLEDKLYNQVVSRVFSREDGATVMLLIAYGGAQTDLLQLHRPEICYPFFGFTVTRSAAVPVPLSPQVTVPGRALTASSYNRTEQILYWTRMGEYLPQNGNQQLMARLRSQMAGLIVDGVLVRISNVNTDAEAGLAINRDFAAQLMRALPKPALPPLLGSQFSAALGATPPKVA